MTMERRLDRLPREALPEMATRMSPAYEVGWLSARRS